jgi:hypothetical protein
MQPDHTSDNGNYAVLPSSLADRVGEDSGMEPTDPGYL